MPDILHRVGIKASPKKVFEALATIEGNRHWWVSDAKGDAGKGGVIDFGFVDMLVLKAQPGRLVQWKCVRGPKEWLNTEITFELVPKQGQTFILFTHAKWKKPVEFMHHCSTKWAVFLLGLRDWLERGEGSPAPYDHKIHAGD